MSSVDFKKCKGGTPQASAMIRHMERHDGRDVEYSNKWVDKARTHLNSVVDGGGTVEDGKAPRSWQTHKQLKERVRQIDAVEPPKRIRKDRVTVVTLTIAAPEGVAVEDEERFFQLAYEEIAKFCGGTENVSKGFVHRDEIHDYIDTDGSRQTSRAHMHMAVIPYVRGIGVNGKAFETRARMRELNAAIDERCREELHVPFLTGKKGRTGRTVEELQAMSEEKAVLAHQQELQEQIQQAERQRLDALRERDEALAEKDVAKTLLELQDAVDERVSTNIIEETDARKTIFGKELPATVTLLRTDYDALVTKAEVNRRIQTAAAGIGEALGGMQTAAREIHQNRVDSFDRTRDEVTALLDREVRSLRQKVKDLQADLKEQRHKAHEMERAVAEIKPRADSLQRLVDAFPDKMYALTHLDELGRRWDSHGLTVREMQEYVNLCGSAGVPVREDIQKRLTRRIERTQERER